MTTVYNFNAPIPHRAYITLNQVHAENDSEILMQMMGI